MKYPDWQTPLLDAITEPDREELVQKIQRAERAISERLQRLDNGRVSRGEEDAIRAALTLIRRIKKNRLA